MSVVDYLKGKGKFYFLKWVQIIQREDVAINRDSMYILEKDKENCDLIFVDINGNKRKVSSGKKGDVGDISILNFTVDDNMHLKMNLKTNSDLNFSIDSNGHLILIK